MIIAIIIILLFLFFLYECLGPILIEAVLFFAAIVGGLILAVTLGPIGIIIDLVGAIIWIRWYKKHL